jgi:hypothetical protein
MTKTTKKPVESSLALRPGPAETESFSPHNLKETNTTAARSLPENSDWLKMSQVKYLNQWQLRCGVCERLRVSSLWKRVTATMALTARGDGLSNQEALSQRRRNNQSK